MSLRTLSSLVDFEFRSDFAPPDLSDTGAAENPNALDTVSVTASELAELLANARAEGLQAAINQHSKDTEARLDTLSGELRQALGELLELAKCLERVALSPDDASHIKALMSKACEHIVAGQTDLFVDQ